MKHVWLASVCLLSEGDWTFTGGCGTEDEEDADGEDLEGHEDNYVVIDEDADIDETEDAEVHCDGLQQVCSHKTCA